MGKLRVNTSTPEQRERHRQAIDLREAEGLTFEKVGERMGVTTGTAARIYATAKRWQLARALPNDAAALVMGEGALSRMLPATRLLWLANRWCLVCGAPRHGRNAAKCHDDERGGIRFALESAEFRGVPGMVATLRELGWTVTPPGEDP